MQTRRRPAKVAVFYMDLLSIAQVFEKVIVTMKYIAYDSAYFAQILSLFNTVAEEFAYKPYTMDSFRNEILRASSFRPEGLILAMQDESVKGFALALQREGRDLLQGENCDDTPGFLLMLLVDKARHEHNKAPGVFWSSE